MIKKEWTKGKKMKQRRKRRKEGARKEEIEREIRINKKGIQMKKQRKE